MNVKTKGYEISTNKVYDEIINSLEYKNGMGWITMFTPTYNRANFLKRPYNSLASQTNKHFIWMLIDDGSKDNTKEVAIELMNRNQIPIMFIHKQNGGKASAYKIALKEASTEFFICIDDDDNYLSDAVEIYINEWKNIDENGLSDIGAIRCLSTFEDGRYVSNVPINEENLGSHFDVSSLDCIYKMNIRQENMTCYRLQAMKSVDLFPSGYPLESQHRFIQEGICQSRFARYYKCRYLYKPVRIYYLDSGESLSRRKKTRQACLDNFLNLFIYYSENWDYVWKYDSKRNVLHQLIKICRWRNEFGVSFIDFIKYTKFKKLKLYLTLMSPIGYVRIKSIEVPMQ